MSARLAAAFTTCQIALGVIPSPQILSSRLTLRKIAPSVMAAAFRCLPMRHTGGLLGRAISMVGSTEELWSPSAFLDNFRLADNGGVSQTTQCKRFPGYPSALLSGQLPVSPPSGYAVRTRGQLHRKPWSGRGLSRPRRGPQVFLGPRADCCFFRQGNLRQNHNRKPIFSDSPDDVNEIVEIDRFDDVRATAHLVHFQDLFFLLRSGQDNDWQCL